MCGPANLRWLSALALFVAIPAAPQATVASHAFPPESAAHAAAEAGTPDLSISTPAEMPQARSLSAEQLGDLHEIRGHYHAAVSAYAQIEHPSAEVWDKMGIAYQMLFDWKDALRCYEQAHRLAPQNPQILNNIATVYETEHRYSEAEHYFHRALKFDPKNPTMLTNLGTNLLMQHKYKAGAKAYLEALILNPQVVEPRDGPRIEDPAPHSERGTANYFLAQSCARAGLNECALMHLRKAFNEGSATRKRVAADHAFDALRNTPELQKLLLLEDD
jgi:tetratricopeptide (TPR) repeat protein